MAFNSTNEENLATAWTPDLFGPIFKKDSMTLKQVRFESSMCIFLSSQSSVAQSQF